MSPESFTVNLLHGTFLLHSVRFEAKIHPLLLDPLASYVHISLQKATAVFVLRFCFTIMCP